MDIIRVLHNKLGISNDTWVTSSVISSWNRDVLSQIKNCFPDLQTQVKMKVLLAFFHIPRRLVVEVSLPVTRKNKNLPGNSALNL